MSLRLARPGRGAPGSTTLSAPALRVVNGPRSQRRSDPTPARSQSFGRGSIRAVARTPPSRLSNSRILRQLREAARKGDRNALTLAVDQMRTLALSPRYWEKYLGLLHNPLARLVDLLAIKQGDRIAHQKGWKRPAGRTRVAAGSGRVSATASAGRKKRRPSPTSRRSGRPGSAFEQPSLFQWEPVAAAPPQRSAR